MSRSVIFVLISFTIVCVIVVMLMNSRVYVRTNHIIHKISDEKNDTCTFLLRNYIKLQVTMERLKGLINVCKINGYFKDRIEYDFTSESLKTLNCLFKPRKLFNSTFPKVALASFPGSGNTMTRGLSEIVTGKVTSTVYSEMPCPSRGYAFIFKTHRTDNMVRNKDCLKVNTHHLNYTKAIYIIRNPYKAILAEYNRQHHRDAETHAGGKYFGATWKTFVSEKSRKWKTMTLYWLKALQKPVYLLVYENLLAYRMREVYSLAQFLDVNLVLCLKQFC
ncbi:WSCD family member CG9164-like [Mercenaria mercenaria]|uniref:WSCD family member CG9164-like n=1 Tax=Mercenaria mercenaria TaxID=6596 RepID=UPI001E1D347F|nr:WSCD family member CG9164-like [Mercenaria mercenaria]